MFRTPVLERNYVIAISWGIMKLNKMLIGPGVHAVTFKLVEHLVCQSHITWRTSVMALKGKISKKGGKYNIERYKERQQETKTDLKLQSIKIHSAWSGLVILERSYYCLTADFVGSVGFIFT